MAWFRLHTDIINDEKVASLSDVSFRVFIMLMAFAKELNLNGVIDKPISVISWNIRMSEEIINQAIEDLISLKILARHYGKLYFPNWGKRQYCESYDRVKKYRAKRYGNVTSGLQENAQETPDSEQITEQSRKKNNSPSGNSEVSSYPQAVDNSEPKGDLKKVLVSLRKGIKGFGGASVLVDEGEALQTLERIKVKNTLRDKDSP